MKSKRTQKLLKNILKGNSKINHSKRIEKRFTSKGKLKNRGESSVKDEKCYYYQRQIKFMKLDKTNKIAQTDITERNFPNYAQALRQLKNADALLQKRKKQLRVQAMRVHKGNWNQHDISQKQLLRKQIKATSEKVQAELQSLRLKQLQRVEQFKKRSERTRQESFKNRQKSRLETLQNKLRAKHEVRLKSLEHQEKIKSIYNETMQRRKSHCQDVYNERKLSRVHFDQFQQSRIIEVRRVQSRERDDLIQRLKMRQKQLCQIDDSKSLIAAADKQQHSTTDITSVFKSQLPYKDSASAYLKKRKKSVSETKMDSNRHQLLILG